MGTHVCITTWTALCFLYVLLLSPALGDLNHHYTVDSETRGGNISIKCEKDSDCRISKTNGTCDKQGWCACAEETPVFVKDVHSCVKAFNFTVRGCEYKEQCQFSIENSDCKKNECVCLENHDLDIENPKCVERGPKPLVPIIVGCALGATILLTLVIYFIRNRGHTGTTHI